MVAFTFVFGLFYAVPLAAAIWALTTLQQIRSTQQQVQLRLAAIERLLQRS
jgi:hypothetical protein